MAEGGEVDVSPSENNDGIIVLPGKSVVDSARGFEERLIVKPDDCVKGNKPLGEAGNVETLTAHDLSSNSTLPLDSKRREKVHVNLKSANELQQSGAKEQDDNERQEHTKPQDGVSSGSEAQADSPADQSEILPPPKNVSLSEYFYTELTRGYLLEHEEAKFTEKRQKVYTFMKIPRELEKFLTFGFFQCVDAFLYIFTFLPLRFLMAFLKLCVRGCVATFIGVNGRVLEPAQICDLLKGVILVSSCLFMNYIDVSMMYHIVRGQAIIKLYIFFNMLEVADRLFSSFGQDILDSLFWTATEPRGRRREHIGVIPHLLLAILYVSLHALLVLFQATTLNVAFNSHNKALLTIMMSNNFVELKGSVFKKFEKHNLFQMSCSDVRERFHFVILLAIVCMRNLTEFSWNMDHLWVLIPDVLMVMLVECLVDWVKHAFITKFNELPAEVYNDYTLSIAYDMAQSRQRNAFSDLLDVVSRRMGFIPLPLAVLLVRVISQSLNISSSLDMVLIVLVFFCLMTFKIFNSIVLLGLACGYIQESKDRKQQQEDEKRHLEINSPTGHKRSKSLVENLSSLDKSEKLPRKLEDDFPPSPGLLKQTSLNSKNLLSNSTVSLASVSLNEDFLQDTKKGSPENSELKHRGKDKKDKPSPPLNEIDRYTMCNNRII